MIEKGLVLQVLVLTNINPQLAAAANRIPREFANHCRVIVSGTSFFTAETLCWLKTDLGVGVRFTACGAPVCALETVLGGPVVGYKVLSKKLFQIWAPKGFLDIVDLGYDYFQIKFDLEEIRSRVLSEGPWIIQGHYLTVRPWGAEAKIDSTFAFSFITYHIL